MRRFAAGLFALLSLCAAAGSRAASEAGDADVWSGRYRLEFVAGARAAAQPAPQIVLTRAPDALAADLVEKYQGDPARWSLSDPADPGQSVRMKRFIAEDYVEWGWAAMHAAGQLQCLDASRLFICRTTPGTTVGFGPDGPKQERLLARTGLFGIALHAGAFELKKE